MYDGFTAGGRLAPSAVARINVEDLGHSAAALRKSAEEG
jgi:hypothetical protein